MPSQVFTSHMTFEELMVFVILAMHFENLVKNTDTLWLQRMLQVCTPKFNLGG